MPTDLRHGEPETRSHWPTRLVWFVVLWLGGVGTVSALAYVLRLWIAAK